MFSDKENALNPNPNIFVEYLSLYWSMIAVVNDCNLSLKLQSLTNNNDKTSNNHVRTFGETQTKMVKQFRASKTRNME